MLRRRAEDKAAAKLQIPETPGIRLARVKMLQHPGIDFDRLGRVQTLARLRGKGPGGHGARAGCQGAQEGTARQRAEANCVSHDISVPCFRKATFPGIGQRKVFVDGETGGQCILRRGRWGDGAGAAGASSANSSHSLSVMAPASSAGSVMVTARR